MQSGLALLFHSSIHPYVSASASIDSRPIYVLRGKRELVKIYKYPCAANTLTAGSVGLCWIYVDLRQSQWGRGGLNESMNEWKQISISELKQGEIN